MNIKIKKITERPETADGYRVYVERTWPLGLDREEAAVHLWLSEIAPGEGAYSWFSGRADRWGEFECGYFAELEQKTEHVNKVINRALIGTVTLLHNAEDDRYNSAVAIRDYIELKKDMLISKTAA